MASYKVRWKSSALKELKSLPSEVIARVIREVDGLGNDPFPDGIRKLAGTERTYRIRVGDYRIVYSVDGDQLIVEIIRVRHRKDIYRR
jgi:mRNA interferase RelE/StbE